MGVSKKIVESKVMTGNVSYVDLLGAGLVKYFGERALTPVIGNGTLMSGAVKLGGGIAARKFLPRGTVGDSVSLGLSIDGVEDILATFLGAAMPKAGGIMSTFGLGGTKEDESW